MSLHINRFIDKLKAAEGRQLREVVLTMPEARDLHADITRLYMVIEELRQNKTVLPEVVVADELSGGKF